MNGGVVDHWEVVNLARKVLRDDAVVAWLTSPNPDLDGRTPWDVTWQGEHQRVIGLLLAMAEGVTS